jgi:hypothetical protein
LLTIVSITAVQKLSFTYLIFFFFEYNEYALKMPFLFYFIANSDYKIFK